MGLDFDDRDYVTLNDHVKAGLSRQNIAWAFRSVEAANWHPLTWISHMADCQIFGLNPAGHHAVSAALHAINAVLLFLLLEKATGLRSRSLCVAALFALHPLNVETVAWISERKSLLSLLFSLLAEAYRLALNGNAALDEARERLNLLEIRSSPAPAVHNR